MSGLKYFSVSTQLHFPSYLDLLSLSIQRIPGGCHLEGTSGTHPAQCALCSSTQSRLPRNSLVQFGAFEYLQKLPFLLSTHTQNLFQFRIKMLHTYRQEYTHTYWDIHIFLYRYTWNLTHSASCPWTTNVPGTKITAALPSSPSSNARFPQVCSIPHRTPCPTPSIIIGAALDAKAQGAGLLHTTSKPQSWRCGDLCAARLWELSSQPWNPKSQPGTGCCVLPNSLRVCPVSMEGPVFTGP